MRKTAPIELVETTLEISRDVSYEELESRLKRAAFAEDVASKTVQGIFSTVLLQERWKEAGLWLDQATGDVYDSPYDAPDDVDLIKTDTPRFSTAREWIQWLQSIHYLSRSTCYARHAIILQQMQVLGRTFEEALDSVMLSPSHAQNVLAGVMDEGADIFLVDNVVALVPDVLQEEAREDIEERGSAACREIVVKAMEDNEASIIGGARVREINDDLRKKFGGDPTSYYLYKHNAYPNALILKATTSDGEETKYVIFVEDEEHKPAPAEIMRYFKNRLALR